SRIIDRGKQLVQSPIVMRWVSDDRVMKAAEGVLDAKQRVRLAWHMLKNGHALPHVDPALDDSLGETVEHNGTNGSAAVARGRLDGVVNGSRNGRAAVARDETLGNGSSSHASSNGSLEALQEDAEHATRARIAYNGSSAR